MTELDCEARRQQRCICASDSRQAKMLARRCAGGELVRVYRGMYAHAQFWRTLPPPVQIVYLARALAKSHPDWVFNGETAACVRNLQIPWHALTHRVTIACTAGPRKSDGPRLQRIRHPNMRAEIIDGIPVTPLVCTASDCVLTMEPCAAITALDGCFKTGLSTRELLRECAANGTDAVVTLLPHVNPASGNGGEAYAHAVMTARYGFRKPQQQVPLTDPQTGHIYRADYYWVCDDGTVIVAELDGAQKYIDPQMTGSRSVHAVVADEREREKALERAGVHRTVRFTFDDVIHSERLHAKLHSAGVPTHFLGSTDINGYRVAIIG